MEPPPHTPEPPAEPCSVCGDLPSSYTARTGYDERFPDGAYRLERLGFSHSRDVRRCPECQALFDWEDIPQFYGSGNLDEECLTRLTGRQSELVRALLSLTLEGWTAEDLVDRALSELPGHLLSEILRHQAFTARDRFAPLLEPLVLQAATGQWVELTDIISSYCGRHAVDLQQVITLLEACPQPLSYRPAHLLNRCRERLPK